MRKSILAAMLVKTDSVKDLILEVSPNLAPEKLAAEADLFAIGALDSYSIVQLIIAFEDKFGITFDYADLSGANFRTLDSIRSLLSRNYKLEFI